jgi:hypothetical protein
MNCLRLPPSINSGVQADSIRPTWCTVCIAVHDVEDSKGSLH